METLSKILKKRHSFVLMSERNITGRRLMIMFVVCVLLAIAFTPSETNAQSSDTYTDNFNLSLNFQNMHIWHGFVVTPGFMMGSSIEFTLNNEKLTAGLWGGANSTGSYREFSYYMNYTLSPDLLVSLISHNNYSNTENPDIFSYNKYTSPNFVDIVFEYSFHDLVPMSLYWSTILFGNGGDYEINDAGNVTDSYSNYSEIRYALLHEDDIKLSFFAGSAFSFTTQKTFYSDSPNIVNAGMRLNYNVEILNQKIPVSTTAFWNPESKIGALKMGISLF